MNGGLLLVRGFALLAILACLLCGQSAAAETSHTNSPSVVPMKLCVATFNLRYASDQGPNSWPVRRPVMRESLLRLAPDILGTQEGLRSQLEDLAADLPDYGWIGAGRDGGDEGEFMAIFYRRERFAPLATNHFWLSDTPEVVASSTWGNTCRRMVTWARFREMSSGREFYFWNTHLDHEVALASEKSAELIHKRLAALGAEHPLILTGDFNCAAGSSRPYQILTQEAGLADTWQMARKRVNKDYNTFQGFREPQRKGVRIDWILARGKVEVEKTEIVTFACNGQFPSDHFPVAAWLILR